MSKEPMWRRALKHSFLLFGGTFLLAIFAVAFERFVPGWLQAVALVAFIVWGGWFLARIEDEE